MISPMEALRRRDAARAADPAWGRTAVYRLFDADGQLLYVGISVDPTRRWCEHAESKPWWPTVAKLTMEWHESRVEAMDAEAFAIRSEFPLRNRVQPRADIALDWAEWLER